MKTLMVTGAGGFIGSVLCRQAHLDYEVIAVDKGSGRSLLGLNVEYHNLDLAKESDEEAIKKLCERADKVIHLAASVGVPACNKDPNQSYFSNVVAAEIIARYAKHIIFSSTTSVYGKVAEVCTENSPIAPLSIYGKHKAAAEVFVKPKATILRFATAFGISPNLRLNLLPNELVYRAMRDKVLVVYEAAAKRSFIHVQDMARILLEAATNDWGNEIYNVGFVNCTKGELAELVKLYTGCDVVYKDFLADPEQRNYSTDYSKLKAVYNDAHLSLDWGIHELVKQMPMILAEEAFL